MDNIAKTGLRYVKDRARQRDTVGQATYRALELVSDGLGAAGKTLRQLGDATRPPARTPKELPSDGTSSKKATTARARARTA